MMRAIWIVARREYLGYVTAWGFWLGLVLTPLGILAGATLPAFLEKSQPVRYYAVVDGREDFSDALWKHLEGWRAGEALFNLKKALSSASAQAQRDAVDAFEKARASGGSPEEALLAANAPLDVTAPPRKFLAVPAPSQRTEEIERLLLSQQTLPAPHSDKTLFAALIVHRDQLGAIESVDYVSGDVVTPDLRIAAEGGLKRLARRALLNGVGLDEDAIKRVEAVAPAVYNRKAGAPPPRDPSQREQSEVSLTDHAPFMAAAGIAMFLWFLIFSVINFLLTGTIEERSNKIFDSLLTSVRLTDLLAGKLLGVLLLSATLMGAWLLMAAWGVLQAGESMGPAAREFIAAALRPGLIIPALAGFLAGYVMYGAIFLALGSLCDTIQEAQTLISPLIILLMAPLLMVFIAVQNPSSSLVQIMSWAPVMTPFLMILRAPLEPPILETVGHLLLMALSTWAMLVLSTRIYRAGAVNGAGLAEARKWFGRLAPRRKST